MAATSRAFSLLLRRGEPRLEASIAAIELGGAALGVLGSGLLAATLLVGRTALFWPSLSWLATAGITSLAPLSLWALGARFVHLPLAFTSNAHKAERWRRAAWPSLALLPGSATAVVAYLDDASNHVLSTYAPARESVLVYSAILYALAQGWFWLSCLIPATPGANRPTRTAFDTPLVLVGLAAAAYVNAAIFLPWIPPQPDLLINLRGARELLAGGIPYDTHLPVWADRVHVPPVTLIGLFAPLAWLPDDAARTIFFFSNHVFWFAALTFLVRRLAPAGQQRLWWTALLFASATYWPWQETIRFGQQDGLLVLLFVLSITDALTGRHTRSGLALGAAIIVKPNFFWLALLYLANGRWRTLVVAAATSGAITLGALPFTGTAPWLHYVGVELPEILPGTARGTNIPLPSLHARLFVGHESLGNGEPAPRLGAISAMNLTANAVGLLLVARIALLVLKRSPKSSPQARGWLLDASLGLALTLLLAPMAWQHYASWLIIAYFVLALPAVWGPLTPRDRAALAALAGAGYFLLSLDDVKLLKLLSPVVSHWPAAMSLYTLGLACVVGALVVARFNLPAAAALRQEEA